MQTSEFSATGKIEIFYGVCEICSVYDYSLQYLMKHIQDDTLDTYIT